MRFHLYCVGLVLAVVGGCDWIEFSPCGWPGCAEGSRCVDHACVSCGHAGETCCDKTVGGEYCTESGYGCQSVDGPGTCTKGVGTIGSTCESSDDCDAGLTCNNAGLCESTTGDPCFSGTEAHTFTIVDAQCGYRWQTFLTSSLAEAEQCRDQLFTAGPGEEMCPTDVSPDSSHVCKNGESFGWDLNHCSPEQLAACEASFCGDPNGCTWADCP